MVLPLVVTSKMVVERGAESYYSVLEFIPFASCRCWKRRLSLLGSCGYGENYWCRGENSVCRELAGGERELLKRKEGERGLIVAWLARETIELVLVFEGNRGSCCVCDEGMVASYG